MEIPTLQFGSSVVYFVIQTNMGNVSFWGHLEMDSKAYYTDGFFHEPGWELVKGISIYFRNVEVSIRPGQAIRSGILHLWLSSPCNSMRNEKKDILCHWSMLSKVVSSAKSFKAFLKREFILQSVYLFVRVLAQHQLRTQMLSNYSSSTSLHAPKASNFNPGCSNISLWILLPFLFDWQTISSW